MCHFLRQTLFSNSCYFRSQQIKAEYILYKMKMLRADFFRNNSGCSSWCHNKFKPKKQTCHVSNVSMARGNHSARTQNGDPDPEGDFN